MTNTPEPQEGDLRVWWIPQVPMEAFTIPVATAEQGAALLTVLAEYDAFQLLKDVKDDYANAGGLSVFEDGEWVDWQCLETFATDPQKVFPQRPLGWCARLGEVGG